MSNLQSIINILSDIKEQSDYPTQATYRDQPEGSANRLAFSDLDVDILDLIMNDPLIENSNKENDLLNSPSKITKAQAISLGYTLDDFTNK